MYRDEGTRKLLYRADRATDRHLFLLGVALLIVIVVGLAAPAIVVIYAMRESQPWWIATGATMFTRSGVAAVLHAIPRILGPGGVTGIVKARSAAIRLLIDRLDNRPSGEATQ